MRELYSCLAAAWALERPRMIILIGLATQVRVNLVGLVPQATTHGDPLHRAPEDDRLIARNVEVARGIQQCSVRFSTASTAPKHCDICFGLKKTGLRPWLRPYQGLSRLNPLLHLSGESNHRVP